MRQQSTRVRAEGSTLLCPWAVNLILSVLAVTSTGAIPVGEARSANTIDLAEIGAGDLLCRTDRGYVPLPMLDLDVTLDVYGIMSRGILRQSFRNPGPEVIDAVYVFPLPEGAAVHRMEIRVGDRRIVSRIEERTEAKIIYEEARRTGRKAALVEQERPNLFTMSVANINPGEGVEVVLEYVEEVAYGDGVFSLTFPLTSTPRFVPEAVRVVEEATGANVVVSPVVIDADRIMPPYVRADDPRAPTASFVATIRSGFPLETMTCASHAVRATHRLGGEGAGEWRVEPLTERVPADRDIVLRWRPVVTDVSEAALITEEHDGERYGLLMIVPPESPAIRDGGLPTTTMFVIDVSGSMDGPSIEAARDALVSALDRLDPRDRFGVLAFNDSYRLFTTRFRDADSKSVAEARGWVRGLEATGGTMIVPALDRALGAFGPSDGERVRRIIFLTDGAVGNEAQLLSRMTAHLDGIRLHAIGIGPAPNRYVMRKMANVGRGSYGFVAEVGEADNEIDALFARLNRPVLTELELRWEGLAPTDVHPVSLPDLHAGVPLFVSMKLEEVSPRAHVEVVGRSAGGDRRWTVPITSAIPARGGHGPTGIATRWARARVRSLLDTLEEGGDPDVVRSAVLDVGFAHHLVTPYTSLVAVEEMATATAPSRSVRAPSALPHGSQLLGSTLPRGGTLGRLRALVGIVLVIGGGLLALGWWAMTRSNDALS